MILIWFLLTIPLVASTKGAYLIPPHIHTQIGGTYVLYITKDNTEATECYVSNSNQQFKIDLHTHGLEPEVILKNSSIVTDSLRSLGDGICGFKVDNVSKDATTNWTLHMVDKKAKTHILSTTVAVKYAETQNKKIEVAIGASVYIYCALDIKDLNYCRLYHPSGELVVLGEKSCSYYKTIVKSTDFGIWKCDLGYTTGMKINHIKIELVELEQDKIITWQNETDKFVSLGCSVENWNYNVDYCLMVRPDGETFTLQPGLATTRYTALHTDLDNAICAMQIEKPLIEAEKGLWRCEQYFSNILPIGGFINVGNNRALQPHVEIPDLLFVHVNSSLTMKCRVSYPTKYCYLRGPDGLLYPVEDNRAITLGLCQFTKPKIRLTDNGTWICGFAKETGKQDDVYQFQVYVPEVVAIRSDRQAVDVSYGSSVELKCSTRGLGDYPLQYCRFLSPDGHMYHIENHGFSERISYSGRGLEFGDCGIKIHNAQKSDQGTWSCITRIGRNYIEKEVYTNIHVTTSEPPVNVASVAGACVGLGIVIFGVAFIAFRKWRNAVNHTASFERNSRERCSETSNDSVTVLHVGTEPEANNTNRE